MASPDWVLDSLLGFLQSPFWNVTVNSFIDHNCVGELIFLASYCSQSPLSIFPYSSSNSVFDPGEENKFTYTDIHREYAALVLSIYN